MRTAAARPWRLRGRAQLREAIERPALRRGAVVAPALVQRLLNEADRESDELPVLQHALMRTYQKWVEHGEEGEVGLDCYEAVGALQDALNSHAECVFADVKAPEDLKVGVLKALGDKDEAGRLVRRPAYLSELCAVTGGSKGQILEIVKSFQGDEASFLAPKEGVDPIIDISHESLIRCWGSLKRWVEEEAEEFRQYRGLTEDANSWETEKDPDARDALLWRAPHHPKLADLVKWKKARRPNSHWDARHRLAKTVRYEHGRPIGDGQAEAEQAQVEFDRSLDFLAVSQTAQRQRSHDEEAAADRARDTAFRQYRLRMQFITAGIVSVVLFVVLVAGFLMVRNEHRQRDRFVFMDTVEEYTRENPRVGALLALEAEARYGRPEVPAGKDDLMESLHRVVHQVGGRVVGRRYAISGFAFSNYSSPDGDVGLVTAGFDGKLREWRVGDVGATEIVGGPSSLPTEEDDGRDRPSLIAVASTDKRVAALSCEQYVENEDSLRVCGRGALVIYDVDRGPTESRYEERQRIDLEFDSESALPTNPRLILSRDGAWVGAYWANRGRIWSLAAGSSPPESAPIETPGQIRSLRFTGDVNWLVGFHTGAQTGGRMVVWELDQDARTLRKPRSAPWEAVPVSALGVGLAATVVTGSQWGVINHWDLGSANPLRATLLPGSPAPARPATAGYCRDLRMQQGPQGWQTITQVAVSERRGEMSVLGFGADGSTLLWRGGQAIALVPFATRRRTRPLLTVQAGDRLLARWFRAMTASGWRGLHVERIR